MAQLPDADPLRELVSISTATEADLPAIGTILRATIQTPYGSGNVEESEFQMELERIRKAFASAGEGRILIAKDGQGQALGFAFFGEPDPRLVGFTRSDPKTTTELCLLYLDPSRRRQGIGSGLLRAVEDGARKEGMRRVELTSGPRYILIGSGAFYSKMGYRLVGTIEKYFEGKFWAKVYQKDL